MYRVIREDENGKQEIAFVEDIGEMVTVIEADRKANRVNVTLLGTRNIERTARNLALIDLEPDRHNTSRILFGLRREKSVSKIAHF